MLIDDQKKFHELQALWWMSAASNGHCECRKMYHGIKNKKEYSKKEKVDDAMKTAQRHIHLFMECAEFKQENPTV